MSFVTGLRGKIMKASTISVNIDGKNNEVNIIPYWVPGAKDKIDDVKKDLEANKNKKFIIVPGAASKKNIVNDPDLWTLINEYWDDADPSNSRLTIEDSSLAFLKIKNFNLPKVSMVKERARSFIGNVLTETKRVAAVISVLQDTLDISNVVAKNNGTIEFFSRPENRVIVTKPISSQSSMNKENLFKITNVLYLQIINPELSKKVQATNDYNCFEDF